MMAYFTIFKIHFIKSLQYRVAAFAGFVTQLVWGLLWIMLFAAFYRSDPGAFPMTFDQMVDYIWIMQAFLNLFALWIFDAEIIESVLTGQVAYQLVRPIDMYAHWFASTLGYRLSRTLMRALPMLVVAFILPEPFRLSLPVQPLLFLVTFFLAFVLVVVFILVVYIAIFYFMNLAGVKVFVVSLGDFMSGGIIPLPFMPLWLQSLIAWTPFAYMQNVPLRVYSGHIRSWAVIWPQLAWILIFVLAGNYFMNRVLRRLVIQGG